MTLGGVFNPSTHNGVGSYNYGIAGSAGLNSSVSGFRNNTPYVYETATIVLTGLVTSNVTISNVSAEYGSTPLEFDASGLVSGPEPSTWLIAGCGLAALCWFRRRPG